MSIQSLLFLDDMAWRHDEFSRITDHVDGTYVEKAYSAAGAIHLLKTSRFDIVFLDHDLSEDDSMVGVDQESYVPTGMTVVNHIMTMATPPAQVIVHSCNNPAATRMAETLEKHPAGIWVRRVPFPELLNRLQGTLSGGRQAR